MYTSVHYFRSLLTSGQLSIKKMFFILRLISLSNNYTMGCPPVRGDDPRA